MTTTLQRLLKHPHAAVFDKAPGAELAFLLQHPEGAAWSIEEGRLQATGGAEVFEYALADYSVGGLAAALQADGFVVVAQPSAVASLSALVLVEGDGDQGRSNGDRVFAFTSLLWALLSSYAGEVSAASAQVQEALRQMVLGQAEGEWLDLWGALYAVTRKPGELDAAYAARIPREAFRLRVNGHGIEAAILDETGFDVRITEPWREIFVLDESELSGPHKLYDGVNAGYHLIRPEARETVVWDEVDAVIERNRAAGVLALQRRVTRGIAVDGSSPAEVGARLLRRPATGLLYEDSPRLDFMMIGDVPILNQPSRHLRINVRLSQVVVDRSLYAITSARTTTYRVYYASAEYKSRLWTGEHTWMTISGSWLDSTSIRSRHTRS
jgi:hypothetical protein